MWAVIPFAAIAILPLGLMIAGLFGAPTKRAPQTFVGYLEEQVRTLPLATKQAIRNDISAAIDVLEVRQIIQRDVALRAKTAPVAELGLTMAPEVASARGVPGFRNDQPGHGHIGGTTTPL